MFANKKVAIRSQPPIRLQRNFCKCLQRVCKFFQGSRGILIKTCKNSLIFTNVCKCLQTNFLVNVCKALQTLTNFCKFKCLQTFANFYLQKLPLQTSTLFANIYDFLVNICNNFCKFFQMGNLNGPAARQPQGV